MRFSLRNSRVQISFLCLRSLLVLLLRLSNTTILSTPRHDNSFKKSLRRVEYLYPSIHSLYMRRQVLTSPRSISFYYAKKSIVFPLPRVTREVLVLRLYAFLSPQSSQDDFPVSKNSQTRLAIMPS